MSCRIRARRAHDRAAPIASHVLVWASGDVAAGTRAADYLGGPIAAGYHLRRFEPVQPRRGAGAADRSLRRERRVRAGVRDAPRLSARAGISDDDPLTIAVSPP